MVANEPDDSDACQDDHRGGIRLVSDARDEDRASNGCARGRAQIGDGARQAGDLALELLGEGGLHNVDGRGQHDSDPQADQQKSWCERPRRWVSLHHREARLRSRRWWQRSPRAPPPPPQYAWRTRRSRTSAWLPSLCRRPRRVQHPAPARPLVLTPSSAPTSHSARSINRPHRPPRQTDASDRGPNAGRGTRPSRRPSCR
jgi:hypothetical protein